jgi:tetratricopeptide (TPR) repeat protein
MSLGVYTYRARRPTASPRPPAAELSLDEVLANLADGRLDTAEVRLRRYLESHPDSEQAAEELRWLYFNQLRTRDVEEFLAAQLQRFPDHYWLLAELLTTEFRKQLPREGLKYLQEVNERHPGQAPVLLALGYCYWQIGELDQAHPALQAALELRPHHPATRLLIAEYLLEQNETDAASALLGQPRDGLSASDEPDLSQDDRWWSLRSVLAERRGEWDEAERHIARAIELRPGELKYLQRQGLLWQRLGRPEESARVLQQANRLEAVHSELSEIVLRGRHEEPSPEFCRHLGALCEQLHQPLAAAGWRRAAESLKVAPPAPAGVRARQFPAGGGPM